MLRTALRPASLGLLVIMLAAATLFAALGHWQLDRARERAAPRPTERVVALATVLAPSQPFTDRADHQRVRVRGRWVAADTVLVGPRSLRGRAGSYVVTALRVSSAGKSALLPVVRGWVAAGTNLDQVAAPPSGPVGLQGRLFLSENPAGAGAGGRLSAISSADLVALWKPPIYTGYLVSGAASAGLAVVPTQPVARHLDLQNLSYAFQWWLFAGFALVLWGKTVRDRYTADLEALADENLVAEPQEASCEDDRSISATQEVSS